MLPAAAFAHARVSPAVSVAGKLQLVGALGLLAGGFALAGGSKDRALA